MTAPSDDPAFNTEVVKLLLQVAWADDVLEPAERAFVEKVGASWKVPAATMAHLLSHLDQGKPLPQPNLALLRTRADDVLASAAALVAADGTINEQETEFLSMVEELLGRA
jgi:uncharacterized tellurite resistance protein B-like protein